MKRMLLVVCSAGILISALALGASASETTWQLLFQAGSSATIVGDIPGATASNYVDSAGFASAQTNTRATTLDDPLIRDTSNGINFQDGGILPGTQGSPAFVGWYRDTWEQHDASDNQSFPWLFQNDYRRPLGELPASTGYVKEWDNLIVWAAPGYQGSAIHLYVRSGTGTNVVPNSINGKSIAMKLVMTYAPGTYSGPHQWVLPYSSTGGLLADIVLPIDGAVVSTPVSGIGPLTASMVGGYRFSLITPEPGSLLALGAGLVSFLGLARRKRS